MVTPRDDFADRVERIRWYHQMELPGPAGRVVTKGVFNPVRSLSTLDLPSSLTGKRVLDVGAWDGFYSFECARRGAQQVLATDSFSWNGSGWGTQDGFILARQALGLEQVVDGEVVDVMDLAPEKVGGPFDLVLLLGVVYHLTDAIKALERVAGCCSGLLILETETALNWLPYPAARIHPRDELNNDASNWYQYNIGALRGLLARVGFGEVVVKYKSPHYSRIAGAAIHAWNSQRRVRAFRSVVRSRRVVIHAQRTGEGDNPSN